MRRSTDRILTTHTGSLPRPASLAEQLRAKERGERVDPAALNTLVRRSVEDTVAKQCAAGVDVVNDGEQSKVAYAIYVKNRLSGFADRPSQPSAFADDFPEYRERLAREGRTIVSSDISLPVCVGPITYADLASLDRDLDNLRHALTGTSPHEAFMTAASPGLIAHFCRNEHYAAEEAYLAALADAMKARVRRHPSRRSHSAGRLSGPDHEQLGPPGLPAKTT